MRVMATPFVIRHVEQRVVYSIYHIVLYSYLRGEVSC